MALFNRDKKKAKQKVPVCACNGNCDVMDAEITEISDNSSKALLETSKEAVKNMGLRMTEVPCPCSARRGGRRYVDSQKQQ